MMWELLGIKEFERVSQAWNRLNLQGPNTALLEPRFIKPLLDIFATGEELIAVYNSIDSPDVLAILQKKGNANWETFQPSQAPIGCWLQKNDIDISTILQSLIKKLPGFTLNIGITQQDPLLLHRPDDTANIVTLDYIKTARICITQPFEEYWASRGKNLRQNISKNRNRLVREGIDIRLETITSPQEISDAIGKYGALESSGWKAGQGTAVHGDNKQGHFYTKILQNFCATNDGKIYQLWYNDTLVATDLCISNNDTIIILKTTYNEKYKKSSPALQMRYDSFSDLFMDGKIKHIEFYGKVMDWHTKWSDEIRQMYHINFYRWKALAYLLKIKPS